MKKRIKNILIRGALLAVIAALLCGACGCKFNAKEKVESPILEYGEQGIPLSFYQLLLARMKGNLARNKYDVKSDSFWSGLTAEGLTYEEHFNKSVLESCKNYLAAVALFDKFGLELPESVIAEIDEEIAFYIDYDGDGSKEEFNKLIADFGIDADSLREAYIIEAKYQYLLAYMYNGGELIASSVKEEYYRENYIRFKQILISKSYYEYERDGQGNIIYFDTESGKRLYDTNKGEPIYDENGNKYRDEDGAVIYFDADGIILYDERHGQPSVKLDENGEAIEYKYTEAELSERERLARRFVTEIGFGCFDAFEAYAEKHSDSLAGDESYPDGYYFSRLESAGYEDYMLDILEVLEVLEVGQLAMIETDYGYHVVMRYGLDEGKYADGGYAEWFDSFNGQLINKLFLNECKKLAPDIVVNSENLGRAKSIKEIGINFDY